MIPQVDLFLFSFWRYVNLQNTKNYFRHIQLSDKIKLVLNPQVRNFITHPTIMDLLTPPQLLPLPELHQNSNLKRN